MAELSNHNHVVEDVLSNQNAVKIPKIVNSEKEDTPPSDTGPENPTKQHGTVSNGDDFDDNDKEESLSKTLDTNSDISNNNLNQTETILKEVSGSTTENSGKKHLETTMNELEQHNETLRKKMNEMSNNLTAIIGKTSPERIKPKHDNVEIYDKADSIFNSSDRAEFSKESITSQKEHLTEGRIASESQSVEERSLDLSQDIDSSYKNQNEVQENIPSKSFNSVDCTLVKVIPDIGPECNKENEAQKDLTSSGESSGSNNANEKVLEPLADDVTLDEVDGQTIDKQSVTTCSEKFESSEFSVPNQEARTANEIQQNEQITATLDNVDVIDRLSNSGSDELKENLDVPLVIDTTAGMSESHESNPIKESSEPPIKEQSELANLAAPAESNLTTEISTTACEISEVKANVNETPEMTSLIKEYEGSYATEPSASISLNDVSNLVTSDESSESCSLNKPSELASTRDSTEPMNENKETTSTNDPVELASENKQNESATTTIQSEESVQESDMQENDKKDGTIDTQSESKEQKTLHLTAVVPEQGVTRASIEKNPMNQASVEKEAITASEASIISTTTISAAKTTDPVVVTSREASPDTNSPFDWSQLGVQRCVNCKFTTDDEEIFKNHVTSCSKTKHGTVQLSCGIGVPMSYTCDSCNISWVNKTEFEEHVVCHIVDSPYLCITCKRNFQSRHAIERHAKADHPKGDSKCALRGMKKCRQYVREVEVSGKFNFQGRITIPRTPRNQIEIPGTTTADVVGNTPSTISVTIPMPRPQISKYVHVVSAPENTQTQLKDTVTLTSLKNKVLSNQGEKAMSPVEQQSLTSLFQVLDKSSPTGTFQPAQIPSKIQKMVNVTTSSSIQLTSQSQGSKTPVYQVKNFTEFTQPQTMQPPVKTLSTTPLYLIPVQPILQGSQIQQINPSIVQSLRSPPVFQPGMNVTNQSLSFVNRPQLVQNVTQPQVVNAQPTVTKPSTPSVNQPQLTQGLSQPPNFQQTPNITSPPMTIATQTQPNQILFISSQANICASMTMTTVSSVNVSAVNSLTTLSSAGIPAVSAAGSTRLPMVAIGSLVGPAASTLPVEQTSTKKTEQPQLPPAAIPNLPPKQPLSIAPHKVEPILLVRNVSNSSQPVSAIVQEHDSHKVAVQGTPSQRSNATQDKDKTYTFRIKPQKGFVCESCRKYTRDELVFRKHIWEHFHVHSMTCKYCKNINSGDFATKGGVLGCKLVAEIVCKLVKKNIEVKNDPVLIDITSDDEDTASVVAKNGEKSKDKGKESQAVEVIVLDDDIETESDNLNIKITSTYSLGPDDLEKMNKEISDPAAVSPTSENKIDLDKPQTDSVEKPSKQREVIQDKSDETHTHMADSIATGSEHTDKHKDISKEASTDPNPSSRPLTEQELNTQRLLSKTFEEISQPTLNNESNGARESPISEKHQPVFPLSMAAGAHSKAGGNDLSNMSSLITKKVQFEANIVAKQGHDAYYMCPYIQCRFSCLTTQSYRDHLQAYHMNEYNYVCCHCGRKEYNEDSHVRHLVSHSNTKLFYLYQCSARLCKYKTNLINMYTQHVKKHEDFIIDCIYCHKKFTTVESLISHLNDNLLKYVSCPHCPFKFAKKNVVLEHVKLFHSDKPRIVTVTCQIVCKERDLHFYYMPKIKKAVEKDSLSGASADTLTIHALLDELEKGTGDVGKPAGESITDISTAAGKNTLEKPRQKAAPIHSDPSQAERTEHRNPVKHRIKQGAGPKSLKCPHCSYLSHNQTFHIQHISSHDHEPEREKRFVCNLCPKACDIHTQFKKHVANHIGRNEIKVFHCNSCPFTTNQKCHIQDHLADNHDKQGLYVQSLDVIVSSEAKCKYCDFRARQMDHVIQHEKAVHRVDTGGKIDNSELGPPVLEKEGSVQKTGGGNKKNKYHCTYCSSLFKHKNDLKEHMEEDHQDITNKQFVFYKCKYCSYTSTMKDFIVTHTKNKHPDKNLTMLRKIETIVSGHDESAPELIEEAAMPAQELQENIVKERIGIPDGNTFKHPFKCTKCEFSSNLRIKVMRHIKEHPELTPVREAVMAAKKRVTARKSTGPTTPELPARKAHGALFQDVPQSQLTNPFVSLRSGEKDTASTPDMQTDKILYILGEKELHGKLSACFIPLEKDLRFQCRICTQKIAKKFVLHRHILNHLNIVFYKCKYCDEGSIEESLIFGHIQKEHSQMPLEFTKLTKAELDSEFKEKIFDQNFNDIVSSLNENDRSVSPAESVGIIKQPVHERLEEPSFTDITMNPRGIKSCPYCEYTYNNNSLMTKHLKYHFDPERNYRCSECHFRNSKFLVLKHIYRSHHGWKKAQVVLDNNIPTTDPPKKSADEAAESLSTHKDEPDFDKNSPAVATGVENKESKEKKSGELSPKAKTKPMFKCIECGILRESVSGMYLHFKSNKKCNKPLYKCSMCYFKSAVKSEIIKHGKRRHEGKKPVVVTQPVKAKMKMVNVPVQSKNDKLSEQSTGSRESSVTIDSEMSNICQICRHKSDSLMTLQYHINTAHGGRMLYCQECQYKTPLVKHIINHCANVHKQSPANYKLQARGASVTSEEDTNSIASAASLTSPITKNYQCLKCDYNALKLQSIRRHLYVHYSYKPYRCSYCSVGGRESAAIKKHVTHVHPTKAFKFRYAKDKALELKMEKVLQQIRRKKMRHDIASGASRPNKLDQYSLVEEYVRADGVSFFCDFCGHKNARKDVIKCHVKSIHLATKPTSGKRSLSPSETDIGSPPRKALKLESTDKKNIEICTSESEEDDDDDNDEGRPQMRYTVVLDADGSKLFKCPLCEYKGCKKMYLKKHMKVHGAKLFQCLYCDFSSKLITNAYRHVENVHPHKELKVMNKKTRTVVSPRRIQFSPVSSSMSPARSMSDLQEDSSPLFRRKKSKKVVYYCCNICPMKVRGKYHFRQHLALHTEYVKVVSGDRASKLPCSYCSYVSTSLNDYSVHLSSHIGEVRFKCLYCDHTYFQRNQLVTHMANSHPTMPRLVVDREVKDVTALTMVDLSPKVCIKRLKMSKLKYKLKKFRRIKLAGDDSSDDSDVSN